MVIEGSRPVELDCWHGGIGVVVQRVAVIAALVGRGLFRGVLQEECTYSRGDVAENIV